MIRDALAVMAGGAVGSLCRWLVHVLVLRLHMAPGFPLATLLVNVAGSFGIGFAAVLLMRGGGGLPQEIKTVLLAGFFGGFTTFSAFSLQTLELFRAGEIGSAVWNVSLSVVLCLGAVWCGVWLAQAVAGPGGR